jgi:hypothetical protein
MSAPNEPTEISITTRMEKAAPGERRAALHACARDVGYPGIRMRRCTESCAGTFLHVRP